LAFACSLCASCDNICPVRIDLHNRLYIQRQEAIKQDSFKSKRDILKLSAWIMKNPKRFAIVMGIYRKIEPLIPKSLLYKSAWGRQREIPKVAPKSFEQIYKEMRSGKR